LQEAGKPYSGYPAELHENPASLINTPARTNESSPWVNHPGGTSGRLTESHSGLSRLKREETPLERKKLLSTNIHTNTTTEPTHKI